MNALIFSQAFPPECFSCLKIQNIKYKIQNAKYTIQMNAVIFSQAFPPQCF